VRPSFADILFEVQRSGSANPLTNDVSPHILPGN